MKADFLNIPLDVLTMDETVAKIERAIEDGHKINHVVINAGKVVMMQQDPQLYESVVSADIVNADGQAIVWAARLLGINVPERVAGADLMPALLELSARKNYKCFFLGAKEEVLEKVVQIYRQKFGHKIIAGFRNGYFTENEETSIAREIADSGAQMLFVAISSPKKENFLFKNRGILEKVNFTMGVGGTFDVIAGITARAPLWMQRYGLEWLYRLIQEPSRLWRRYLIGNTKFILLVAAAKFRFKHLVHQERRS